MAGCPTPPAKNDFRSKRSGMVARQPEASANPGIQAEGTQSTEGSALPGLPWNPAVAERELILPYGLTRSEASLAASLVRGESIDGVAGERSISEDAGRIHLKRILMKTDAGQLQIPSHHRTPTLQS